MLVEAVCLLRCLLLVGQQALACSLSSNSFHPFEVEVFGTSGFKDFNGWVNTFGNIMYIYSPLIPQKDFTYISICVCMYVNIFDLISWPYKMHWTHCHIDLFTTCRVSKNKIHTFVHHFSPVTFLKHCRNNALDMRNFLWHGCTLHLEFVFFQKAITEGGMVIQFLYGWWLLVIMFQGS